jgi:outer membrane biogenesis lipoprotein LolB
VKKITLLAFSMFLLLGLIACSNQKGQASNSNDQKTFKTQEQSSNKKDVKEVVLGSIIITAKRTYKRYLER